MNRHPVTLEDLADRLDGRLDPARAPAVEAHLAEGCPDCRADLAWLRRIKEAAQLPSEAQPPAALVAQVKATYRSRSSQARSRLRWPFRLPLAPQVAVLAVLILVGALLLQAPIARAHVALLEQAGGTVEARPAGGDRWQPVDQGASLHEGDWVRVSGGSALVGLFDGSLLALEPGAEVRLGALRSAVSGTARRVGLHQATGTVRYDVPLPVGWPSTFRVQSPSAAISGGSATFVVTVDGASSTRVEVLRGTVTATGGAGRAVLNARDVAYIAANAPLCVTRGAAPSPAPGGQAARTPAATSTPLPGPGQPVPGGPQPTVAPAWGTPPAPSAPAASPTAPAAGAGEGSSPTGQPGTDSPGSTPSASGPGAPSSPTRTPGPSETGGPGQTGQPGATPHSPTGQDPP